jgi:hypothetical protein
MADLDTLRRRKKRQRQRPEWGVNAKKTLTERNDRHNVEDRIGCELVKLHIVNKENPT